MTKVRPRQGLSSLGCNRASNCGAIPHDSLSFAVVIWTRKRLNQGLVPPMWSRTVRRPGTGGVGLAGCQCIGPGCIMQGARPGPGPGGGGAAAPRRGAHGGLGGVLEEAKMTKVRPRQGLSCLGCNRASNCAHESVNKTVVIWKRRNLVFLVQCGRNSYKCIPKGVDGIPFYSVLVFRSFLFYRINRAYL